MRTIRNIFVPLAALMLLAACSGETRTAAITKTQYQQLSSTEWVNMTAAPTAAHVDNNGLIMMR